MPHCMFIVTHVGSVHSCWHPCCAVGEGAFAFQVVMLVNCKCVNPSPSLDATCGMRCRLDDFAQNLSSVRVQGEITQIWDPSFLTWPSVQWKVSRRLEVPPKQNTFVCRVTQGFPVDSLWIPYRFHIDSGGCEAHELLDFGAKRRAVGCHSNECDIFQAQFGKQRLPTLESCKWSSIDRTVELSRKLAVASWVTLASARGGAGLSPTPWFFTWTPPSLPPKLPGHFEAVSEADGHGLKSCQGRTFATL